MPNIPWSSENAFWYDKGDEIGFNDGLSGQSNIPSYKEANRYFLSSKLTENSEQYKAFVAGWEIGYKAGSQYKIGKNGQ